MKKFHNILSDQKGLTLIEVLAVLAVSGIVLTVFYNVFIMGIKTYQKTGVEVQLREEADYVLSSLLDVLYQSNIDKAEICSVEYKLPCIRITENKVITQDDGVFMEDSSDETKSTTFIFNENITKITKTIKKTPSGDTSTESVVTDTLLASPYKLVPFDSNKEKTEDFADLSCNERNTEADGGCKSGLVKMTIRIQDTNYSSDKAITVKPLLLSSEFGF